MQDISSKVVTGLSEFKEDHKIFGQPQVSLLTRINNAQSVNEVNELLKIGAGYLGAKPKTLKMWARAAASRVVVIGS
jgi:hypothetical protein